MPQTQPISLEELALIRQRQGVGSTTLQNLLSKANMNQDQEMAGRLMEVMNRHAMEDRRLSPRKQTAKMKPGVLETLFQFLSAKPITDELGAVNREFRGY